MRINPYGDAPMKNPGNIRQAMNENDPRQRGLLGAAFVLGYFARFACAGASAISFGATTGPQGVVWTRQPFPQPYFDEEAGGVFPLFHVQRSLAELSGQPMIPVASSAPNTVQAVGAVMGDRKVMLIANLTDQSVKVALPFEAGEIAALEVDGFTEAARSPDYLDRTQPLHGPELVLKAYAVARVMSPKGTGG